MALLLIELEVAVETLRRRITGDGMYKPGSYPKHSLLCSNCRLCDWSVYKHNKFIREIKKYMGDTDMTIDSAYLIGLRMALSMVQQSASLDEAVNEIKTCITETETKRAEPYER